MRNVGNGFVNSIIGFISNYLLQFFPFHHFLSELRQAREISLPPAPTSTPLGSSFQGRLKRSALVFLSLKIDQEE